MPKPKTILENAGLDTSKLNRLYVNAKITVSPYDYTLRDRAIVMESSNQFSDFTSIFTYGDKVEHKLVDKLGLSDVNDLRLKDLKWPWLKAMSCYEITSYKDDSDASLDFEMDMFHNTSYMYKHNDLLINDKAFSAFIPKALGTGALMEAMLKLHVAINAKDAIFPQLTLSRLEGVDAMPLDDAVNLRFAKDELAKGHACLVDYLGSNVTALYAIEAFAFNFKTNCPSPGSKTFKEPWQLPTYAEVLKQNVIVAGMYFCELFRAFESLDDGTKDILSPLLFPTIKSDFMDAFGTHDPASGRFVPDDELADIVKRPANERYARIPAYVHNALCAKTPYVFTWTSANVESKETALGIGEFKLRIFSEMHHQSWQDYRIKYYALLLQECKARGIDVKDLAAPMSASGGVMLPGIPCDGTEVPDFGDPTKGASYDSDSDEDEPEDVPDKHKSASKTTTLETMDNLIKTCDARYTFDVKDVKNVPGYANAYNSILTPIEMITKQLTKQIREIKTYNTGGKVSGKSRGKIDAHTMYRYKTDPKIFYDNTYKVKEMDLAFGIILDQSGSMCGEGVAEGRIALILLHHVLNSLRINHAIIGHTSYDYHHSEIMRYVYFNEDPKHTLDTPYVLANLKSHNGNCDSGALNYMEQYIKRTRNKDKIVLIFSDGEPTECSETELRQQVRKMEREGIHVIGLGINFENIKMYYPDHANGRNMKEMVDILVSILKRYVLEKED